MVKVGIKVPKRRVLLETKEVERGKPRERETQILVGELFLSEMKFKNGTCKSKINVCHLVIGTEYGLFDIIFLIYKRMWIKINEISEVLKSTRESSGLSLKEVSNDLDISELILTQIEEGSIGAFKDIFELKEYISTYAKYLGLNPDEVMDEFNEYMFEKTSRIPMNEIEDAAKESAYNEANEKRIATPYTKAVPIVNNQKFIISLIIVVILAVLAVVWSIKTVTVNSHTTHMISYFAK